MGNHKLLSDLYYHIVEETSNQQKNRPMLKIGKNLTMLWRN